MKPVHFVILVTIIAAALGGFWTARLTGGVQTGTSTRADSGERNILYWVAPMDPNFRRDQSGLSPMGMELIPVYEDEEPGAGGGEPALWINPAVVNNIGVRTEVVRRADMARDVRTVGNIMADEEKISHVHVRSEGWIENLVIEAEGEPVTRGGLLFQIYSPALVAAQSEYLQAVRLGRPALLDAAAERLTALGMTRRQIAQLRESGTVSRLVGVYAPQSGVVTALNVREGMFVQPNDTTMSLVDLSTVWVLADVFETQAGWVAPGQRAIMTLPAFPGETWEGEIDYVYPIVETRARTVRVRLRFPNPGGRLKLNMYADISIDAAPEHDVLIIPQSALIRTSQGDRVILALGDGRFRPAQVVAGMESGDHVEILTGLEAGERVVTSGQFLIDSEASLDAALLRLSTTEIMEDGAMMAQSEDGGVNMSSGSDTVFVAIGRVQSVDAAARRVVLDHDPVPELNWPSMTMGFSAAQNVPIENLEEGAAIRFEFRQTDDGYQIVAVEPLVPGATTGAGP